MPNINVHHSLRPGQRDDLVRARAAGLRIVGTGPTGGPVSLADVTAADLVRLVAYTRHATRELQEVARQAERRLSRML